MRDMIAPSSSSETREQLAPLGVGISPRGVRPAGIEMSVVLEHTRVQMSRLRYSAAATWPWGRRLRAMREHPEALASLVVNVRAESMKVYVLAGGLAAVAPLAAQSATVPHIGLLCATAPEAVTAPRSQWLRDCWRGWAVTVA